MNNQENTNIQPESEVVETQAETAIETPSETKETTKSPTPKKKFKFTKPRIAIAALLVVAITLSALILTPGIDIPGTMFNSDPNAGMNGTKEKPYQVYDVETLRRVGNGWSLSAHYVQTADIDLTGTGDWTPIGNLDNGFSGSYDGGMHTITGLVINNPNGYHQGLFGHIKDGSVVKNIRLINANVTGKNYVGAIAGYLSGTVLYCTSSGTIKGELNVGGLVGGSRRRSGNCIVEYSYATGEVVGKENVGGLMGQAENISSSDASAISGSYAAVNVTGNTNVGGLVGNLGGRCTVGNSVALNPSITSTSNSSAIGRIAGVRYGTMFSDNYALRNINLKSSGYKADTGERERDGANLSLADATTQAWWDTHIWNKFKNPIWKWANGTMPYLFENDMQAWPYYEIIGEVNINGSNYRVMHNSGQDSPESWGTLVDAYGREAGEYIFPSNAWNASYFGDSANNRSYGIHETMNEELHKENNGCNKTNSNAVHWHIKYYASSAKKGGTWVATPKIKSASFKTAYVDWSFLTGFTGNHARIGFIDETIHSFYGFHNYTTLIDETKEFGRKQTAFDVSNYFEPYVNRYFGINEPYAQRTMRIWVEDESGGTPLMNLQIFGIALMYA